MSRQKQNTDTAPVVLVLASGRGERFAASGGAVHKLRALLAGRTVLEHTRGASAGTASVALLQQTGPRVGAAAFAPALCALWLAVAACTLPALALRRIQ